MPPLEKVAPPRSSQSAFSSGTPSSPHITYIGFIGEGGVNVPDNLRLVDGYDRVRTLGTHECLDLCCTLHA
eukprot:1187921-Prorocentrum_minimum.AAC.5